MLQGKVIKFETRVLVEKNRAEYIPKKEFQAGSATIITQKRI